jgi:hypothetical protein
MLKKLLTSLVLSAMFVGIMYAFRDLGGELLTSVGAVLEGLASLTLTILFAKGDDFIVLPDFIEVVFNIIVYAAFILLLMRIVRDMKDEYARKSKSAQ